MPPLVPRNDCKQKEIWILSNVIGYVTAKTFYGTKTAKAALPLRHRLICQGKLPLSVCSGPLNSTNGREEGIVKYYCQDRQET